MTWTDLCNPVPRREPLIYEPVAWAIGEPHYLTPPPPGISLPPVDVVIEGRRTRRDFGPVPFSTLSHWLWWVGREMAEGHSGYGFPLTMRPVPSAGAIHPIHILISRSDSDGWHLYLPEHHAVAPLDIPHESRTSVRHDLMPVIDIGNGVVIRLVAEYGKTAAKYEHSASLIWRDAGVMLGQMALVAEALTCNFCPLGITGQEWIGGLKLQDSLAGVGLAVLGSR
ncbi:dehydrogenase [Yersinia enterocolitica]|nr:dehydrogenase [Yersinia enterocolitica]EKN3994438.1 dehydrogenase [Yersinia enterocolitica]EKN5083411.1 dehydrogenase [Yersinia enterocolitica]EKN6400321.1 dehydrogenase [Yersinia enterocolitica]EKP3833010.1 dehydrogenase [Yersinia enterocolitica]